MDTDHTNHLRIAVVYEADAFDAFRAHKMSLVRWLRMSEALARRGYLVDMIVNTAAGVFTRGEQLRFVPPALARWDDYDVIKTCYHRGFATLRSFGGHGHPFIISRLAAVVWSRGDDDGMPFEGEERETLHDLQREIARCSRVVSVNTDVEAALWREHVDGRAAMLVVPTGVDREIPPPGRDPYGGRGEEKIALYVGNLRGAANRYRFSDSTSREVVGQRALNLRWQAQLNELGGLLRPRGIRLCFVGVGDVGEIDPERVTLLGAVDNDRVWDHHHFADVGVALAQGERQINECSKIYYYLRAGLPVVSERPIVNNALIEQLDMGLIAEHGDVQMMADMIETATRRTWSSDAAMEAMRTDHTWDARARVYDDFIKRELDPLGEGAPWRRTVV